MSVQISKETKSLKSFLEQYNSSVAESLDKLTLVEALDPALVNTKLEAFGVSYTTTTKKKRDIIDAYLTLCRSKEEIVMLKQECNNLISYYESKRKAIMKEIEHRLTGLELSALDVALLYNLKDKISTLLEKGYEVIQIMNEQEFEEQFDNTTRY